MKKPLVLASALLAIFLAPSLLAQQPVTDYDHSINFYKFKTYNVVKVHATDPGVEDRLLIALDRDLQQRYLHPDASNPDLTIAVVESNADPAEYTNFYSGLSGLSWERGWASGFMDGAPMVGDIKPGTLVINIWDHNPTQLIWRGIISEPDSVTSSKEADQKLDKAIGQVLAKFPPKPDKGSK
jgi:hypothetical protein